MNCAVFKYCMIVRAGFQISLSASEWESEAPPLDKMLGSGGNSNIAHQTSKEKM